MNTVHKAGIGVGLAVLAVIFVVAVGLGGITLVTEIQEKTNVPVIQQEPDFTLKSTVTSASNAPSAGDIIDQLDFKISGGDVKSMIIHEQKNALMIFIDTYEDGELFVDLDPQFIGSLYDGFYFVIINNEEFNDYEIDGTKLYIPLELGVKTIKIVGSYAFG